MITNLILLFVLIFEASLLGVACLCLGAYIIGVSGVVPNPWNLPIFEFEMVVLGTVSLILSFVLGRFRAWFAALYPPENAKPNELMSRLLKEDKEKNKKDKSKDDDDITWY